MSGPAAAVDFPLVRQFVEDAEAANMFTESRTFEAKERRNGNNVAEAVAALSSSDGGVVLVGVMDRGAVGAARMVGVEQAEHDSLVSNLQNLLPTAMPEIVPVRIPDTSRLVIVLRCRCRCSSGARRRQGAVPGTRPDGASRSAAGS